jgi:MFS family permease
MRIRLALLGLCWPLVSVGAQAVVQLTPATRLRVSAESPVGLVQTGSYRGLTDTTLALFTGGSLVTIPLADITRVEISRGRKPSLAGGIVGFVLGGAAGGVVACTANRDDYGVFCGGQNDSKLVVGAALGGAVGAALGALLFRREKWRVVDVRQLHWSPVVVPRSDR